MNLRIATSNKHKVKEISDILKNFDVSLIQEKVAMVEPDFDSLEEIASFKAKQAFEKLNMPVIAEDTGVYFKGYNNFPGVFAKRVFLGIGFGGLKALIDSTNEKGAYFKTVICYKDVEREECFSGQLSGKLLGVAVSREKDRLPYEKIFVPDGFDKALVDFSVDEKNEISHRAIAANKLGEWLKK